MGLEVPYSRGGPCGGPQPSNGLRLLPDNDRLHGLELHALGR